eukprot:TRINITY_DN1217_c0_g1_i3.p1 TRINITY_DN1217_c0_g1~~TRINITY_DN1217_c0_g1_i3.p1  ORF type:complete len:754 (+),score=168.13 TRINITY_DN1217_c0_g1_i3:62-2323(+)
MEKSSSAPNRRVHPIQVKETLKKDSLQVPKSPKDSHNKRRISSLFRKKSKRKKRLFGQPIEGVIIPEVIIATIEFLKSKVHTEGLFRQSASVVEMESIKRLYETGKDEDWKARFEDPHTVANLLVTYLLQLPEPLLCYDLYESFIAAEETVTDETSRSNFLRKLLSTLPTGHHLTLDFLLGFLAKVSDNSDKNKMNARNLGIVFGPALLRRREEDLTKMVHDSMTVISIVRTLIEKHQFYFKTENSGQAKGLPTPKSTGVKKIISKSPSVPVKDAGSPLVLKSSISHAQLPPPQHSNSHPNDPINNNAITNTNNSNNKPVPPNNTNNGNENSSATNLNENDSSSSSTWLPPPLTFPTTSASAPATSPSTPVVSSRTQNQSLNVLTTTTTSTPTTPKSGRPTQTDRQAESQLDQFLQLIQETNGPAGAPGTLLSIPNSPETDRLVRSARSATIGIERTVSSYTVASSRPYEKDTLSLTNHKSSLFGQVQISALQLTSHNQMNNRLWRASCGKMQSPEKLMALQNLVSSSLANIKHQIAFLQIQMDDRLGNEQAINACRFLLRTVIQLLKKCIAGSRILGLSRAGASQEDKQQPQVEVSLASNFSEVKKMITCLEVRVAQVSFASDLSEALDYLLRLGIVSRDVKKLLDDFQDSAAVEILQGLTPEEAKRVDEDQENDPLNDHRMKSLSEAQKIVARLRELLANLRSQLLQVLSLDEAVCLARVIRTVKKVCRRFFSVDVDRSIECVGCFLVFLL